MPVCVTVYDVCVFMSLTVWEQVGGGGGGGLILKVYVVMRVITIRITSSALKKMVWYVV